jgi:hypothetical protein
MGVIMKRTAFTAALLVAAFGFTSVLHAKKTVVRKIEPQTAIFDKDGKKLPDSEVNSSEVNWVLLSKAASERYRGMGHLLVGGFGGCSATLIDMGANHSDTPAYVLTNGHCMGMPMPRPDQIIVDSPLKNFTMQFDFFVDSQDDVINVPVKRIVYGTMKGTDAAILELKTTVGQLLERGIRGYEISARHADQGEPAEMIGIPGNGVRRSTRFLRRSECKFMKHVPLMREGGYEWRNAVQHACSSVGGSSGSSMVSLVTGKIIAVNNTGVDDSALDEPECSMNRPCEVNSDGSVSTNADVNYAQSVHEIATCFTGNGKFSLNLPGCQLEKPKASDSDDLH